MRRLMMMAGALGVALVMSSGAFAQVPPDPNNPNEKVPEKMLAAGLRRADQPRDAKKVAEAALARSDQAEMGYVRRGGRPERRSRLFRKNGLTASMRRSPFRSTRRARRHAIRRPTVVFERLLGKGDFFAYLPTLGDAFIASRGGNPLIVDGKIVGAIGVSGGTGSQDDTISQAGVAALK